MFFGFFWGGLYQENMEINKVSRDPLSEESVSYNLQFPDNIIVSQLNVQESYSSFTKCCVPMGKILKTKTIFQMTDPSLILMRWLAV